MNDPQKRFKIALSFPGEKREFVREVANHLSSRVGADFVLYDHYYEAEFARPDLDTYLQRLYHDESELIAVFLCEDYERKEWCGLEWRVIRDLIKRRKAQDIMPLRFDNTEISGLFSIDGYVWIGERNAAEIAKLILRRTNLTDSAPSKPGLNFSQQSAVDIDIDHLPSGAEQLFGRSAELQLLDAAWAEAGRTTLVELIALGGVGKTSLVREWLDGLRTDGWRGAKRVFGWSFYSQGSSDERQASEDPFLAAALAFFRVERDPALGPHEKGKLLAAEVAKARTLLILDGLEPLQYPPARPLSGELKAPGVETLLTHLANVGQPGLCLITTRERVKNLAAFERNDQRPHGGLIRRDLSNLAPADGAHLLHQLGANRAGEAAIGADDPELIQASKEVRGHALTLSLLGRYLKLAHGGDIRRRDQVDFNEADVETLNGHAFKAMAAYQKWFEREGEAGARPLAMLRLLGFFDRPATPASLAALRADPPIPSVVLAKCLNYETRCLSYSYPFHGASNEPRHTDQSER